MPVNNTATTSSSEAETTGSPWVILVASAALTQAMIPALSDRNLAHGDVRTSVVILTVGAALAVFRPTYALALLFGLYIPLNFIGLIGWAGDATCSYLAFVIAIVLVFNNIAKWLLGKAPKSDQATAVLPGQHWAICLGVVFCAQWLRSVDMQDSFYRVCDMCAFVILLWMLPTIQRHVLKETAQAFVLGTVGCSIILLKAELFSVGRMGILLHFNADFVGYVVGVALVLTLSRDILCYSWLKLLTAPILATTLYFSGGRAAFYGTAAAVLLMFWLERRYVMVTLTSLAGCCGVYFLLREADDTGSLAFRMLSPFLESFGDASARRDQIWTYLIGQRDAYWLIGMGVNNASYLTGQAGLQTHGEALAPHNIYLGFWVELGVIGLVFFVLWQVTVLWVGLQQCSQIVLTLPLLVYYVIEGFFAGTSFGITIVAFMVALSFVLKRSPQRVTVSNFSKRGKRLPWRNVGPQLSQGKDNIPRYPARELR